MITNKEKITEALYALNGLSKHLEKESEKSPTITRGIVDQYENFLEQMEYDLPGILLPFNKHDHFAYGNDDQDVYYYADGIKGHATRNWAKLQTQNDYLDNNPVLESQSFSFISNQEIKQILERDYKEIQKNIISSNWKSAIVLCGGSFEAILLDLLEQNSLKTLNSPKAPKETDLSKWDLHELIEVAVEQRFIKSRIADLGHTVREYRNLVHPGVEVRKKLKVESEETKLTVAILQMVIRDLSEAHRSNPSKPSKPV